MLHAVFIIYFRTIQTLSWCQRVVRISRNRENLTAIESTTTTTTTTTVNSGRNLHTHTAFQEAFREDFEYSDFF